MSDENLTSGQLRLLDTLAQLDTLELGSAEPATVFRPSSWASGRTPGFDLAALAAGAARSAARPTDGVDGVYGTNETPARGRAPRTDATSDAEAADDVPPPCLGVAETVAAVRAGKLTPGAVLDQVFGRIDALDTKLNAIVTVTDERARGEAATVAEVLAAGERPRPLSGVPLAHKDNIAARAIRTTAGSNLLRGHVPADDASVVARLSNAGTLMVGKTNTHEFATGTTGTVSCFGPTRNPWKLDHIAGGSSCGAAAAIAAGMVPAATGSDTGGSIRIPSACCGTVGLKPTYGRVSRSGVVPFAWSLDHVGPMGRSARDVATLLTAMAGHDPFDPASTAEPSGDFAALLDEPLDGVRFAVPGPHFLDLATAPVAAAVHAAAAVLEQIGARRVEIDMPDELESVGGAALAIFLAEGGAVHKAALEQFPQAYCKETRAFLGLAPRVSAHQYLQAQRLRARLSAALARVFQNADVLVTPTLPITAPRQDVSEVEMNGGRVDVRAALTLYTRPFNLTGLPAVSVPCGFDAGLPIGLQLVGRPYDEAALMRVAHAYETASDWHERRPPGFS